MWTMRRACLFGVDYGVSCEQPSITLDVYYVEVERVRASFFYAIKPSFL